MITTPRYCQTRYPTLYELAAIHPDGRRYLIGYSIRKGRRSLWNLVTQENRVEHVKALVGTSTIDFALKASEGATMGEWTIRFTGRTARDCQGRENPFIVDEIAVPS